jgi:hypothetical protein
MGALLSSAPLSGHDVLMKGVIMEINNGTFDETWKLMYKELSGESERACSIVGIAYIDDLLGQVIEHYLLENKEAYKELLNPENINAPLSSFGARISAAYGIGLISKSDLDALRKLKKVRNLFAHNINLSFRDDEVKPHCIRVKQLLKDLHYTSDSPSPREIFQSAIANYSGRFKEKLYLMKAFNITGGFKSVLRLNSALSDALESKKSAG